MFSLKLIQKKQKTWDLLILKSFWRGDIWWWLWHDRQDPENYYSKMLPKMKKEHIRTTLHLMMKIMMINCIWEMTDHQKALSLFSMQSNCQMFSPSHTSGVPHAGLESVQNLSSGSVKWSYAVVIAITPWCHFHRLFGYSEANLNLLHIETGVNGCLSFIFYNGISTS